MKNYYNGHFIRKNLGQNFLYDKSVINSIISSINPKRGQIIVEIGPGLASLTEPIVQYLDHLIVIELDRNLANRLRSNNIFSNKLTIYQQDVMSVNFRSFSEKANYQPIRIFGNLPYNISTKIIFYLFKYIDIISDMHFMLQKEVGNRLIAQPNNKLYGRLSIMTQFYCQITPILEVSADSFIPKPRVDSIMVKMIPHKVMPYSMVDPEILSFITLKSFSHRRKKIFNNLKDLFTIDDLIKIGIDPKIRAENISVMKYCQIANSFIEKTKL